MRNYYLLSMLFLLSFKSIAGEIVTIAEAYKDLGHASIEMNVKQYNVPDGVLDGALSLEVSYKNPNLCYSWSYGPTPINGEVKMVFVLEQENGGVKSVTLPLSISCRPAKASASTIVWKRDLNNPQELFNKIFPLREDGTRWFAAKVAISLPHGQWDSNYGQNYSIVLK